MALNPNLYANGIPVAFVNEMFVLIRDGVEFQIDKIPGKERRWLDVDARIEQIRREYKAGVDKSRTRANGGVAKAKGKIYLSNIRMVFVADKPTDNFIAFDMPLLYVHGEKFNQPIFYCNNISGLVEPVVPDDQHRALYSTHSFKILFKEGGCGTFVPLFFNLIKSVRQYNQQFSAAATEPRAADPLRAAETPVDEMMRCAYVDPSDPTRIFLQQPNSDSQLRRRTYHPQPE